MLTGVVSEVERFCDGDQFGLFNFRGSGNRLKLGCVIEDGSDKLANLTAAGTITARG